VCEYLSIEASGERFRLEKVYCKGGINSQDYVCSVILRGMISRIELMA